MTLPAGWMEDYHRVRDLCQGPERGGGAGHLSQEGGARVAAGLQIEGLQVRLLVLAQRLL